MNSKCLNKKEAKLATLFDKTYGIIIIKTQKRFFKVTNSNQQIKITNSRYVNSMPKVF